MAPNIVNKTFNFYRCLTCDKNFYFHLCGYNSKFNHFNTNLEIKVYKICPCRHALTSFQQFFEGFDDLLRQLNFNKKHL